MAILNDCLLELTSCGTPKPGRGGPASSLGSNCELATVSVSLPPPLPAGLDFFPNFSFSLRLLPDALLPATNQSKSVLHYVVIKMACLACHYSTL